MSSVLSKKLNSIEKASVKGDQNFESGPDLIQINTLTHFFCQPFGMVFKFIVYISWIHSMLQEHIGIITKRQ